MICLGIFLVSGCQNSPDSVPNKSELRRGKQGTESLAGGFDKLTTGEAHIQFEAMDCNLGSIGPLTTHNCEFKLQNTGPGKLVISGFKIAKDCDCKGNDISYSPFNETYAPGQSGVLIIPYISKQRLGEITEYAYVRTNDSANPVVKLAINATVEDKVYYEPRHIRFAFDKPNAGCKDIIFASTDGRPFSIKRVITSGDILSVNIDPAAKEKQFVIEPVMSLDNLRKTLKGRIEFEIDHPECENIVISFEAIPEFRTVPAALTLVNTIPGEIVTKQLKVLSNYRQDFAIESIKSQNNFMEVIEQKPLADGFVITLKITPPVSEGDSFNDTLLLQISDDRTIEVKCIGLYRRNLHEPVACENRKK